MVACAACHGAPDPTFDADEYLPIAWNAARDQAPDGVMLKLHAGHIDAGGRIHYAQDGSLAITMLSRAHNESHQHDCEELMEIVGPEAGPRPNDPILKTVSEWRPGPCDDRFVKTGLLRCTFASLWERALRRGAPGDAQATIEAAVFDLEGGVDWTFVIDQPRFVVMFYDDCYPLTRSTSSPDSTRRSR